VSTPELHRPPVYACHAGAVLHAHSADTLEPAVVLWTYLPHGASDSIDAVDLAIQLQEMTGQRIKPQDFKNIRTVDDVVTAVRQLLSAAAA